MKIDFSKAILGLNGEPLRVSETDIVTLRGIATGALLDVHQDDVALPGDEKAKRFVLALSIENAIGPVDIKVEDVALIKRLIGRNCVALVVGRAYELLDA